MRRRRVSKEDQEKMVARSVLQDKSTEELLEARDWIQSLLAYRASSKLHKTYITGIERAIEYNESDKVFCSYNLDGTATGRLSCGSYNAEKPMGVSFHTLPRDTNNNIRNIFVANKGESFITIDYAGMELRVLAHVANDEVMQKAFLDGADLHSYSASLLFNKPQDSVSKDERQIAKATSFLIVYGGTAFTLSNNNRIPIEQAERIIDTYMEVFPGIGRYIDNTYSTIQTQGEISSIFGRKRRLPNVFSDDTKLQKRSMRQGLNFTIQSAASDIILCAIKGLGDRLPAIGARLVSTVHDSLEIVCPQSTMKECLEVCYDEMVNTPTLREAFDIHPNVPLKIDSEVGRSFGDGQEVHYSADGKVENEQELLTYLKSVGL